MNEVSGSSVSDAAIVEEPGTEDREEPQPPCPHFFCGAVMKTDPREGIRFRAKTPEAACVGFGAHAPSFDRLVQWRTAGSSKWTAAPRGLRQRALVEPEDIFEFLSGTGQTGFSVRHYFFKSCRGCRNPIQSFCRSTVRAAQTAKCG